MSMAEGEKVPILRGSQLTHGTRPRMVGTTIIRVAYGLDASDKGPGYEYVLGAERAMHCFNTVFQPGRYLVQTFPWLRYVPAWFPGASFQRVAREARTLASAMKEAPYDAAKQAIVSLTCIDSSRVECSDSKTAGQLPLLSLRCSTRIKRFPRSS